MTLALLCMGALAMVCFAASALIGLAWTASARWRAGMSARAESRLLLAAALAPGVVGLAALGAALLPSLGWLPDHCLAHAPHHPHLCVDHAAGHATGALSLPLLALAGLLAGRWLWAGTLAGYRLIRLARTSRALADAAHRRGDLYVLPMPAPEAFVMGLVRPRVYVSEGLVTNMDMAGDDDDVLAPVLAHERAHARRRDPLRVWIASLALACHLPGLAAQLARALRCSQEMAADEEAAAALGDAPRVAQALVRLAHMQRSRPGSVLAFTGGSLEARVQRLLAPPTRSEQPTRATIAGPMLALLLGMLMAPGPVHHALETILGLLS